MRIFSLILTVHESRHMLYVCRVSYVLNFRVGPNSDLEMGPLILAQSDIGDKDSKSKAMEMRLVINYCRPECVSLSNECFYANKKELTVETSH